ncbi:anti-sigma-factor antagonist [Bacillus sp. OxB-1]|uniref:STAS domain-containing protein n=1 Tax=Bacillus sp. (strain OxB-1) TaxID=98228 RepID=UPI000581E8E7|nr:STAS domain-containing protein [Bacillus sp. OxB-1]BAQ08672.1 anti-sigma-factor antagonist [Bacillus sp. OxB-1]
MGTACIDSNFKSFLQEHKQEFENVLQDEASNVRDRIKHILEVGNIDLINNAHLLVLYVIDGQDEELQLFAKQEGIAWATHSIPLAFKLEWVQAIRRTLWCFIERYSESNEMCNFFVSEKQINNGIDQFLNSFFINYSMYKEELLLAQRKLVETLSVPIIPITPSICILPLIGTVDSFRTVILEEKVLTEINRLHIQTLIIDLSGIVDMEDDVVDRLMRIISGISLMGCRPVLTGLRGDLVRRIVGLGVTVDGQTKTFGTLQQALNQYLNSSYDSARIV